MNTPRELLKAADLLALAGQLKTHPFNPLAVRTTKSLGDAVGLTELGVHWVSIEPGHDSTAFHRHLYEEEFLYVLSGQGSAEIGEQQVHIAAGDFLGFPKNGVAHALSNTGSQALVCLVAGQRLAQDVCDYPHLKKRLYINGAQEDLVPWAAIEQGATAPAPQAPSDTSLDARGAVVGAAPLIRPYQAADWPQLWPLLQTTFATGDTYAFMPDSTEATVHSAWVETPQATYVAIAPDGALLGSYTLKPNQPGLGAHVCNCGYVVAAQARGQGIASALCEHSQTEAIAMGFKAMQFNLVVSTNEVAVRLWQKHGFRIVGTLPGAFAHQTLGLVDAHVMFKTLVR